MSPSSSALSASSAFQKKSIAILGGGITGLTAAHRLTQLGHRVRLFEQSARLGGAIRTERTPEGWLIEAGPNSLQETPAVAALIAELGLTAELVPAAPAAKNRYVVRAGQLVPLPLSPPAFLASSLFSLGAKARVLAEFLRRPRPLTSDRSFADFIRDHFGSELFSTAAQPFVSGIYAGDPEKLSARFAFPTLWQLAQTHGSLLRGQLALAKARRARGEPATPRLVSFRAGLQTLTDTLAARLPVGTVTLNARVESLRSAPSWQLTWRDLATDTARTETFDTVLSALPAASLATLEINSARSLASLAAIEHPPVSALFLGYRREQISHALDGFGLLVPATEKRSILGVIFNSTLFPARAPAGHVALNVMIGGALQPDLARLPTSELLATVAPDLRALLGVTSEPAFVRHTFWPRAIPQYNLGHDAHLATLAACERAHPGLHFGGQIRDGISLPACLAAAERLAATADTPIER